MQNKPDDSDPHKGSESEVAVINKQSKDLTKNSSDPLHFASPTGLPCTADESRLQIGTVTVAMPQ